VEVQKSQIELKKIIINKLYRIGRGYIENIVKNRKIH